MYEYVIRHHGEKSPGPAWDPLEREQAVIAWRLDVLAATANGHLEPQVDPFWAPSRVPEGLASGALTLYRRARRASVAIRTSPLGPAAASQPVGLAELGADDDDDDDDVTPAEHRPVWIEITVVDGDGRPISDRPYRLRLSDGTTREGKLPLDGVIRFDDVEAGPCTLVLPTQQEAEWAPPD